MPVVHLADDLRVQLPVPCHQRALALGIAGDARLDDARRALTEDTD